jgi:FeS assembly protein IscX
MLWTDIYQIAEELEDKYPDADVINIRFTDLRKGVITLEGFSDEADNSNEKILESIQAAWIEERK